LSIRDRTSLQIATPGVCTQKMYSFALQATTCGGA